MLKQAIYNKWTFLNQAKTFCINMNIQYVLVPLNHITLEGFCLFLYLDICVGKIYFHYFAISKWMYFSDKYFFFFLLLWSLIKWTFVICAEMHFDIQYSRPSLRIVGVSAVKDKNAVCCYFWILSHAFDNNFYNAALYVLPEAPCIESIWTQVVWKKFMKRCYSIFCLESNGLKQWIL